MKYDCGCVNEIDEPSGVLRAITKCEFHLKAMTLPETRNFDYYKRMGCFNDEYMPQFQHYITELAAGLASEDFVYLREGLCKSFLELGAGLGVYIPFFLQGGAHYVAVENAPYAVEWLRQVFYIPVIEHDVETLPVTQDGLYHCIMAAHILEHVTDAPALLKKMYRMVRERIYLIVPDDRDPVNPDHLWFFTKDSLHVLLRRTGFKNIRYRVLDVVPQESFIYCVAER